MADEVGNSGRSRVLLWIGGLGLGLPLVYVLSIGPAAAIVDKVPSLARPTLDFYTPVIWLHDHAFLKGPLETYVNFWENAARHI
jgi:hypothetical protein